MTGHDGLLDGEPGCTKTPKKPARPTFCSNCLHSEQVGITDAQGQRSVVCLCTSPMFALPARIDYVTGAALDDTRPRCSDMNRDGACPGFRHNWPVILMIVTVGLGFWSVVLYFVIRGLTWLANWVF